MRSLVLASLFATLSLVPANADISWKTEAMAPGSSVTLQNDDGRTFTHLRRSAHGAMVRFDTFAGKSESGAYLGSYLTDGNGAILRSVAADGSETDYMPHKCNRALGKCTYIIQTPEGTKIRRTRITEATSEGLKFAEYEGGQLVSSGVTRLDRMGSVASGWTMDHATGRKVSTRQVSAVYR